MGRNFNPEIGFVRRLDMRRNYGLLRYSPRPRRIAHVRKFSFQGTLNYTTNTTNRLDTREAVGQFQTEFTSSDIAIRILRAAFRAARLPFAIAPGIRIPAGEYDYHTTHVEYQGGQQRKVSGTMVVETGTFYDGTRTSVGVSSARVQVTPQVSLEPSMQVDWVDLVEGSFIAKVVRTRATYTLTPRSTSAASSSTTRRMRQLAATCASGGSTGQAAKSSWSTPTTTTPSTTPASFRCGTGRLS